MSVEVEVTCPACSEVFDLEFDPEQEINETECPECEAELTVTSYDPATGTVELEEVEEEEEAEEPEGMALVETEEEEEEPE